MTKSIKITKEEIKKMVLSPEERNLCLNVLGNTFGLEVRETFEKTVTTDWNALLNLMEANSKKVSEVLTFVRSRINR